MISVRNSQLTSARTYEWFCHHGQEAEYWQTDPQSPASDIYYACIVSVMGSAPPSRWGMAFETIAMVQSAVVSVLIRRADLMDLWNVGAGQEKVAVGADSNVLEPGAFAI